LLPTLSNPQPSAISPRNNLPVLPPEEKTSSTNPKEITQYANAIHNSLQFIPTTKTAGQIDFVDLTITRKPTKLEIDIFRKPTTSNM
jgi:hypothetical protein